MEQKYLGISNGKKYPVYKVDKDNKKIGLTKLKCMTTMCWCTFEEIVNAT